MKHDAGMVRMVEPLLDCIGNTPLIELDLPSDIPSHVRVYAKLESMNPGGSMRDRPIARILMQARMDGHFTEGRGLLDACHAHAGISYAMLGAAMGIPVTLVMPKDTRRKSLNRILAHGAEIVEVEGGMEQARAEAQRLAEESPEHYWWCDQYRNPAGWQAHYYHTAAEILSQLAGLMDALPDALVVGVDTGATLTGAGRRLRIARPDIHVAVAVPASAPGIEGLKPLGPRDRLAPPILDKSLVHEHIPVTQQEAWQSCRLLARQGLFVGPCAGAYAHAALKLAECGKFSSIVTLLAEGGTAFPGRKRSSQSPLFA